MRMRLRWRLLMRMPVGVDAIEMAIGAEVSVCRALIMAFWVFSLKKSDLRPKKEKV